MKPLNGGFITLSALPVPVTHLTRLHLCLNIPFNYESVSAVINTTTESGGVFTTCRVPERLVGLQMLGVRRTGEVGGQCPALSSSG